jgi:NADH-quinone oxidoreductase subunit N
VVSVVVGSTVALRTESYRRMLGYAGVAQVGYGLIALAALNPSGALFFMATYAVGTTAAFLGAETFERLDPDWDGTVSGLAGLGRRYPAVAASVTVALLSLAGIPPLLGFWGKFQVFGSVVQASTRFFAQGQDGFGLWLAILATVGVLGAVVSLGYYGAVVRALFIDVSRAPAPEDESAVPRATGARALVTIVIVLAALLVTLGMLPLLTGVAPLVRGFLPQ